MNNILVTSGYEIAGYEIKGYLGFINEQIALGSDFIKQIVAEDSGGDIGEHENGMEHVSEAAMENLEQVSATAIDRLKKNAKSKGANGIIGMQMSYTQLSKGYISVGVTGTAVKLVKSAEDEYVSKDLYVSNYYNRLVPRPVKVILSGDSKRVKIETQFYNYNQDDIKAIRADVELTNLYEEKLLLKNLDFVFERGNVTLIESNGVECKLPAKDIMLIKDSKVTISKYVTSRGVYACNDVPVNVDLPLHRLAALKEKRGIDAVTKYITDGMTWTCNCGYVNEAGSEECMICARSQSEMKSSMTFNPDEMLAKMQTKEFVFEIKDVLMEYIKDIDTGMRMELLEIMESGIQYEKTRGNMKDTVIEKVEKVFEGH